MLSSPVAGCRSGWQVESFRPRQNEQGCPDPMSFFQDFGARLCQQVLDMLLQVGRMWSNHASDRSSIYEQDERWQALDSKARRREDVFLGIHLCKMELTLVVATEPCIDWGQYAAGRTPVGSEINNYWKCGVKHSLFKVLVAHQKQVRIRFCHSFLFIPLGNFLENLADDVFIG